ncbi:Protein AIM2-like protein 2 [Colletotrichum chlorophyti]|uniref:Protein AIM2-like protein 2 n=1 Tax=Colletotrichum chlorophyti TaxID=708187 RepID=A0A1Q8S498_9PEZI|nr:Protein AIM2-like protein 2 [Colletotrichum chlorophyti]
MLGKTIVVAILGLASSLATATPSPARPAGNIVRHTGQSVGQEVKYNGLTQYISKPKGWRKGQGVGVLYLTDVFGIQLNENRLLTDSFARAGYVAVAPDLFNGQPAPYDINIPGFNTTQFLSEHGPNVTDPIIVNAINYLKKELGVKKIVTTGYCFGGRYAFRFIAEGKGASVAFAAHPSLLEDAEIQAITGPASVAAAEVDSLMPTERRVEIENLLLQTKQPYSLALYGGTQHGFATRGDPSDPKQKFGKEEAFYQAVRFFDNWA